MNLQLSRRCIMRLCDSPRGRGTFMLENEVTDPLSREFLSASAWLNLKSVCFNFILTHILYRTTNYAQNCTEPRKRQNIKHRHHIASVYITWPAISQLNCSTRQGGAFYRGLCESSFLSLRYSFELLIEYSSMTATKVHWKNGLSTTGLTFQPTTLTLKEKQLS